MSRTHKSYRGHTSAWQLIKTLGLILACAGVGAFYGYPLVSGLTSGAVKSLKRRSDELVYLATEPGWFTFNITVRAALMLIFLTVAILMWRGQLRERLRDL